MSSDLSKLFDTLSEKLPHPLDPYLNAIQRRAYTAEYKDWIVERRRAVDPDFLRGDQP